MKEYLIHVLVQPYGSNDYWIQRLLEGIKSESQRIKKHSVISFFSLQEEIEPSEFSNNPVVLVGTTSKWFSASVEYVLSHNGIPFFVNACLPEVVINASGVCFALDNAVYKICDYIKQLNCKKPVLIGLNPSSDADHRKAYIFKKYSAEIGFDCSYYFCDQMSLGDSIENCVGQVLDQGADSLFCSNDTAAILTISCLKKRGIDAGSSFPVIGMGNSFLGMSAITPLTTVSFDYYSLGREAIRLHEYLLSNDNRAQILVKIPAELIIRESTGCIPFSVPFISKNEQSSKLPNYFGGDIVNKLIMLENDLQQSDNIDREIIIGTVRGETYKHLSTRLFLSERTLKYRLSHILHRLGLRRKSELSSLVEEVLGEK